MSGQAGGEGTKKLIASNPSAHQNYFIEEKVEAGIVLQGTEIKSIRNESPNLKDSFVEVSNRKNALLHHQTRYRGSGIAADKNQSQCAHCAGKYLL